MGHFAICMPSVVCFLSFFRQKYYTDRFLSYTVDQKNISRMASILANRLVFRQVIQLKLTNDNARCVVNSVIKCIIHLAHVKCLFEITVI